MSRARGIVRAALAAALVAAALSPATGCALWRRRPNAATAEFNARQQAGPKQEVSTKRTGLHQHTEIRSTSFP